MNGIDGGDERVVITAQAIENVILEFIIVDLVSNSSKFRGKALHLREELGDGHVQLFYIGKGDT
jgi:hypothetical protein